MLLGSGECSRELTITLRRLDVRVIAVEGYAGALAHEVADQSLVIMRIDVDEVAAAVERLQPDFVVTASDAISLDVLDAISVQTENDFTELVPSDRSVRLTADREGLRQLAAGQLGLPTAPFWFVGSIGALKAVVGRVGYPLLMRLVAGVVGQGHLAVSRGPTVSSSAGGVL